MAVETYLQKKARERAAAAAGARAQAQADSYRPPSSSSRGGNFIQRAPTSGTKIGPGNLPDAQTRYAANAGTLNSLLLNRSASTPHDDTPAPPSNPGGPGGGSPYGGGGSGGAQAQAAQMSQGLQALLKSGRFGPTDISDRLAEINGAVSADQGRAASANASHGEFIGGQANPYADVALTSATRLDPTQADLLSRLGGDAGVYEAEIGLANTLAAQGETADQRFLNAISAGREAQRQDSLKANAEAGEFAQAELAAAGLRMRAQAAEIKRQEDKARKAQEMQIILQLIQSNAAAGVDTDLSAYGMGGA